MRSIWSKLFLGLLVFVWNGGTSPNRAVGKKSSQETERAIARPLSNDPDTTTGCPVWVTAVDFHESQGLGETLSLTVIYKNESSKDVRGVQFFLELLDGVAISEAAEDGYQVAVGTVRPLRQAVFSTSVQNDLDWPFHNDETAGVRVSVVRILFADASTWMPAKNRYQCAWDFLAEPSAAPEPK